MSTMMAAQQAKIASLESQMAQLGTQNSPIAIGVQTSKWISLQIITLTLDCVRYLLTLFLTIDKFRTLVCGPKC